MYPKAEHGFGTMHASVWDITSKLSPHSTSSSSTSASPEDQLSSLSIEEQPTYSLPEGITPGSVDVISVIFVLSALHPREWKQAIHNLYTVRQVPSILPCLA